MIKLLDRESGKIVTETVLGGGTIRFAYNTLLGRTLWPILFGGKFCSALLGKYYDSRCSRGMIKKLMRTPGCRVSEREKRPREYKSFNDYFARRLKPGSRPYDDDSAAAVSPGDGRLMVYSSLAPDAPIPVKGAKRSLRELCGNRLPEGKLSVAVLRLAPIDDHRYHFPCDCIQKEDMLVIPGKYHSVNPAALLSRPDIYVENSRTVTNLSSNIFGDFVMLEVGAFGVGSIVPVSGAGEHRKMDEKGYFKFGGSTVILVFRADAVKFSDDLLETSANSMETLVRCGQTIAVRR